MANLKKKDAEEVKVDVTVTPQTEEGSAPNEEKNNEQVETKEDTVPTVDVEVAPADAPKVDVDTTPVNPATQATQKNVRIRMRADHKCWLNSEVYELKKGQCYNVPVSLKKRLNKAGLLLPL